MLYFILLLCCCVTGNDTGFSQRVLKCDMLLPESTRKKQQFIWQFHPLISQRNMSLCCCVTGNDTWVFPVLQLPPLRVLQDSSVTQTLLESTGKNTTVHMTIPYFNLPEKYVTLLLQKSKAKFNILIPHPSVSKLIL